MEVFNLSTQNSLLQQYVTHLRNVHTQTSRLNFRKNVERIGQIMAYEISKKLVWKTIEITTPLATSQSIVLTEQPVLATILRAGLAMHNGMLSFFDEADSAYISAYRKHSKGNDFEVVVEYLASPDLTNKTLLLIDPMLATGQSMVLSYNALLKNGTPKHVHVVSLIASTQGINYVAAQMPNATLWVAAVDDKLNNKGYIVPGLGDAGDLSYGTKLEH